MVAYHAISICMLCCDLIHTQRVVRGVCQQKHLRQSNTFNSQCPFGIGNVSDVLPKSRKHVPMFMTACTTSSPLPTTQGNTCCWCVYASRPEIKSADLGCNVSVRTLLLHSSRHKGGLLQQFVRKLQSHFCECSSLDPVHGALNVPASEPLRIMVKTA